MIIRRTEKLYYQKDEGVLYGGGNQTREYRKRTWWLLFIPIYTTYTIIAKVQ